MKKFFIKLDLKLFKLVEAYILKRVAKTKHKKNKFFIMADIEKKLFYFWLVVGPIYSVLKVAVLGNFIYLGSGIAITAIYASLAFLSYKFMKAKGDDYEFLFQNRKHPIVYEGVKNATKQVFEINRSYRSFSLKLKAGVGVFLFIANIGVILTSPLMYSLFSMLFDLFIIFDILVVGTIYLYIREIFDFDPPKPKKRKQKESLTELVLQQWKRLLQNPGFVPSPT